MKVNLTDKFIDELYQLGKASISPADNQLAKNFLIDYIGATFAGASLIKERGNKLLYLLNSDGGCSVIGFNKKSSPQSAVFINGYCAHVAELDDGVISGSVHPGSPLFSALLTVGEIEKVSPHQFLIGVIVGYEAIIRLANTIQPSHKKKGYHATATCGAIGTAIGISAMLGISKEQMKNAFSCAVISAAGTLKAIEDNSDLKPFNVANAALNGYMAVSMARAGFQGPEDVLTGQRGFFNVMTDDFDDQELVKGNSVPNALNKVYVKPYAACRYCHPAIDAALSIKDKYSLDINQIKEINVKTYQLAVHNHDHTLIETISSAKMSIPFSVAVALKTGKAGISEFSKENVHSPELSELTKKVSVFPDVEFTSNFPDKSMGSIEITTESGEIYKEKVEYPKGEPENPLSQEELIQKFKVLMDFAGKNEDESGAVLKKVFDLENNLDDLYPLL